MKADGAQAVPEELLDDCHVVIVNDHELAGLLPGTASFARDEAETATALAHAGIRRAIVTLGPQGSVVFDSGEYLRIPAVEVKAVDTTGSGDAFAGAVGYGLWRGLDLVGAARLASEVGSFAAKGHGARASYPTMRQLERWREN